MQLKNMTAEEVAAALVSLAESQDGCELHGLLTHLAGEINAGIETAALMVLSGESSPAKVRSNITMRDCAIVYHAVENRMDVLAHAWAWQYRQHAIGCCKGGHAQAWASCFAVFDDGDDTDTAAQRDAAQMAIILALPYFTGPNEVKYLNSKGKTTTAKIGKAVAKLLPALPEKARHKLADALKQKFAPRPPGKLKFIATDAPDEWVRIYKQAAANGLSSCMTNRNGYAAIRGYACADLLPTDLREEQMDFALAYLTDDDGIPCARAIVDTRGMKHAATYCLDGHDIDAALNAAGYRPSKYALDGMYIFAGEYGDRAPYLDGHHNADYITLDDKSFWHVAANGTHHLTETTGLGPDLGASCDCCEEITPSNELTEVNNYQHGELVTAYVCDECLRAWYTYLPDFGGYFCDSVVTRDVHGNYIVTVGDYADDYIDINGELYHIDDTTYVDFLDAYIPSDVVEDTVDTPSGTFYKFWDDDLNQQALDSGCHVYQLEAAE